MLDGVVVVGGGATVRTTVSYLKAAFGDRIGVPLVESGRAGASGVGEAASGGLRHFSELPGPGEEDWLPARDATRGPAVRFENRREPGHRFHTPSSRCVPSTAARRPTGGCGTGRPPGSTRTAS
ncbi:tryptophan 7-halogenase [Streptomyces sp. Act-28]